MGAVVLRRGNQKVLKVAQLLAQFFNHSFGNGTTVYDTLMSLATQTLSDLRAWGGGEGGCD